MAGLGMVHNSSKPQLGFLLALSVNLFDRVHHPGRLAFFFAVLEVCASHWYCLLLSGETARCV
jgi:hypothetical protein